MLGIVSKGIIIGVLVSAPMAHRYALYTKNTK